MQPDDDGRDEPRLLSTTRRRLLGAAAVTGAVASVGALRGNGRARRLQADEIDPVYGFPAASSDVPPPVEPDHEVSLDIRDVQGRELPDFVYDPVGLAVDPGDVVRFNDVFGAHSVTAYHPELERTRRVPEEVPPFASPLMTTGAYWLYRFDTPGVYDVYCIPHEEFGMVMRLVVGGVTTTAAGNATSTSTPGAATATPSTGTSTGTTTPEAGNVTTGTGTPTATQGGTGLPEFPPTEAALGVFDDPALTPENIVAQGSVAWDDLGGAMPAPETPNPSGQASTFSVQLSGANEVPPVETEATGEGMLRLTGSQLEYELFVNSIEGVTQAHVHEGAAGENGPIRYALAEYTQNIDGSGGGSPRSVIGENVLVISGVVDGVDPGLFETPETLYVNVHTVQNPGGEIRGQLMASEESPTGTPTGTPSGGVETGTPAGGTETPSSGTETGTPSGTGTPAGGSS